MDDRDYADVVDGFGTITFSSFKDAFRDLIDGTDGMLNYPDYVWRGERRDDWVLESRLERLLRKEKDLNDSHRPFVRHLNQFKYAARGRRGSNPIDLSLDEWWALGQHHGLWTPLLDWTFSPFVAIYFAFAGTGDDQTGFRAVYALHKPSVEQKARELFKEKKTKWQDKKVEYDLTPTTSPLDSYAASQLPEPTEPEVQFIQPLSNENPRLVNQAGLFTRFPPNDDIKSWVQRNFPGENTYILRKMLIPNDNREDCLKALNRMNINHLTLFPDLFGASKFCNLFYEIEGY